MSEFQYSERQACKLISMDRTTYRYQPRPDHNAELRSKLLDLARQKPRYGYRRVRRQLLFPVNDNYFSLSTTFTPEAAQSAAAGGGR